MDNQNVSGKGSIRKWALGGILLAIIIIIVVAASSGGSKTQNNDNTPQGKSVDQLARERFNEIKNASPELDTIECENNCESGVAYFKFKTTPQNLETVIRGNTATYSKFMMDNGKGSNVAILATQNGNVIFQCSGAKGAVKECK